MIPSRVQVELDSTLGYLYLAVIFSSILWGVSCLQLYLYYEKFFRSDKLSLRLFVLLIWILDTIHQAILIQSLYVCLVKEFGNLLYLSHPQRTLIDGVIFAALVDTLVQFLFVSRVWQLSNKNYLLTGGLVTVLLAQFGITTSYFGQIYHFTNNAQLLTVLDTERAMNALVVVADTLIAGTLIFLLWSRRSGFRKTDSIIKRLITYTIGTGLVTGLWGIVGLIGAQVLPDSFIYLLVDLVMPRLYFNCMLASLNARSSLRQNDDDAGGVSIRLHSLPGARNGRPAECDARTQKKVLSREAIPYTITTDIERDAEGRKHLEGHAHQSDIDMTVSGSSAD